MKYKFNEVLDYINIVLYNLQYAAHPYHWTKVLNSY
jgi:hypothetical protein